MTDPEEPAHPLRQPESQADLRSALDRIAALERKVARSSGDQAEKKNESQGKRSEDQGSNQGGDDKRREDVSDEKKGQDKKDDQGKGGEKDGNQGQDDEPKSHKPSKKAVIVGVVVVLLILAAVLFFWLNGRNKESTDDAYVAGHVHQISSRVAGTVEGVEVDDNEQVKEGQVLVRLDPRDYQVARDKSAAALVQAEAQLLQARAQVAQSDAAVTQAQAQVSQQQAQVAQAQANLDLAQINFNRNRSLFQRDAQAVAKADVDTTQGTRGAQQAALDAAKANVDAGKANVQAVQATAEANKANVEVAEANVAANRASVADADLQLSYCRIVAPVGGRVSRKTVEEGQRLSVGQALLSVVPENVWVLANFKETQLERLTIGQRVDVKVDALSHHVFLGTVDSIQEGTGATFALLPTDNATGNFTKIVQRVPVKIVFDEASVRDFKDKIVPGLSVIPTVDLLSAAPGKPTAKMQRRENQRQKREEKQSREREEGKL